MLMPKRMRWRKQRRGRMKGKAMRGNRIDFGEFGIVAMAAGWITSRQIEAARISMTRHIRRGGKVWIRVFPDKPYTKKPLEQRMGKGKAGVEGYVAVVKPGRVMFEMEGVSRELAYEAMRRAIMKLPIPCKFMTKAEAEANADQITGTTRRKTRNAPVAAAPVTATELTEAPDAGTPEPIQAEAPAAPSNEETSE